MTQKRSLIIGGVAGGMSAATRLRRLDENARITVLERGGPAAQWCDGNHVQRSAP